MGAQRCEPAGMEFAARSGSGDRVTAILEGAEEVEARYVVMSTHGRSGFVRWRLGSVADKVVQGARRPTVLVLPQLDVVLGERIGRITVALDGSALAERPAERRGLAAGAGRDGDRAGDPVGIRGKLRRGESSGG